jgi:hypothetical protein
VRVKRLCAGMAALLSVLVLTASASASHDVTERLSQGPIGGNGAVASNYRTMSSDGSRVFFQTTEKLISADTDSAIDIYERSGATTTLISTGPIGGNGAFAATMPSPQPELERSGISQDGTKVFFRTAEKLVSADTDNAMDIYLRSAGTTTLISPSPTVPGGPQTVFYKANTLDGSRVFFETAESLVAGDSDIARDVYQWLGGTLTRLSTGPSGGNNSDFDTFFEDASADGTRVVLGTDESLTSSDTDLTADVYERFGSTTTHLSIGPAGGNGNIEFDYDAFFDGASADGTKVWLDTDEVLTADDTDIAYDIYERSGATITRVSTSPSGGNGGLDAFFNAGSADGTRVFFDTIENLVAGDTDFGTDIYVRSAGATALVSTGPSGGNGGDFASFAGITGSSAVDVFFSTPESLVGTDTDGFEDVYQRDVGSSSTTLISNGNGQNPAFFAGVGGTAPDLRVFYTTDEPVVSADTDLSVDIYERQGGVSTFLSEGHNGADQDINPLFRGSSADGTKVVFDTVEPLLAEDTDSFQDTYAATQGTPGGFPRPKGATPVRVPLAPSYTPCGSPNRAHAPGLSFPSCNPPAQASPLLTIGTPDANGQAALANNAFVRLRTTGVAGGADDSDVVITATLNDVRNTSGLTDYTGELQVSVTLNITDKDPVNALPSTLAPVPLLATIPCTTTVSTTIGSDCTVTTTADTLTPGMVPEGRRVIWELGRVDVLDGGTDGVASTPNNNVFQSQALFVP